MPIEINPNLAGIPLLENQTTDTIGDQKTAIAQTGFNTLSVHGDFGGAVLDVEQSRDNGLTWFSMGAPSETGSYPTKLHLGWLTRCTVSGAGASTDLSVYYGLGV